MTLEADYGPGTHSGAPAEEVVSDAGDLQALLTSWEGNETSAPYRVIGLASGDYGAVRIGHQFTQPVVIQPVGSFAGGIMPVTSSAVWNMDGSANVVLHRLQFTGANRVTCDGATSPWMNRCSFQGANVLIGSGDQAGAWSTAYAMNKTDAVGMRWTGCEFTRFKEYSVWIRANQSVYEYNLHHDMSRDDWKIVATPDDVTIQWNLWTRDGRTDQDAHADWGQVNNGNGVSNLLYQYNIGMKGTNYLDNGKISQGLQAGGAFVTDSLLQYNYLQTKAVNGLKIDGSSASGTIVQYNDVSALPNLTKDFPQIGGYPTRRYNFSASAGVDSGTDSLSIDIRSGTGAAAAYFRNGYPARDAPISSILAAVGTARHQDYTGGQIVGCSALLANLEAGGAAVHGNWGMPIAPHYSRLWDHDDGMGSTYNGQFDQYGNNASSVTVPTYPTISTGSRILAFV